MQVKKFVPVMLTPFKNDGSIDYSALEELVEFYLESGARGLFANCLSSEMYQLTEEERLESTRFIVDKVKGRVPVVSTGTYPGSIRDQSGFIQKIYDTGVECVIVITSQLVEENEPDEMLDSNMQELFSLTGDIPLGFYECPVPYKRVLKPELLGMWVQNDRIKYHKDTCLDIDQVKEKIQLTQGYPGFGLYDAYMVNAVKSLRAGAEGLSCIQGNYFPELVVWLCDHYDKEIPEVEKVQQFFTQNMDLMHETYPASAKYILKRRGLDFTEYCRNGSKVNSAETYKKLDLLHQDFKELADEIGLELKRN